MNNYLAFIRLDYYTIREYLRPRTLLLYLCIFLFIAWSTDAPAISMLCCMSVLFVGYPFSLSERDRLDFLYASLPLSRKQLVLSRYLFSLVMTAVFLLAGFVIQLGLRSAQPLSMKDLLGILLGSFFGVTTILLVQLPFLFRLPYSKARLASMLPLFVIFALVPLSQLAKNVPSISTMLSPLLQLLAQNPSVSAALALLLWLAAAVASLRLSQRFYLRREF